jgi:hypothetical protein
MTTTPTVADEVVVTLGGAIPVGLAAGTALPTVYLARREGHFQLATAVLKLAAAVEPDNMARQLALAKRLAGLLD